MYCKMIFNKKKTGEKLDAKEKEEEKRDKEEEARIKKSATEKRFDEIIREPGSVPGWQTAARMTQIVDSDSTAYDMDKKYYENAGLEQDFDYDFNTYRRLSQAYNERFPDSDNNSDYDDEYYQEEEDEQQQQQRQQPVRSHAHHRRYRPAPRHSRDINSWETLNHVLSDKPWSNKVNRNN